MTLEVRPLGVRCNIQCQYCYQNPPRDAGNVPRSYDLEVIKQAIVQAGGDFTLFGGEPLLVPLDDLDALWSWSFDRYGRNAVQTNGSLITDAHHALFARYHVQVGISIDGPGALNDVRWAGTLAATREATRRTETAIERLCRDGHPPSLIITLHRGNATADKLPIMHDWLRTLERLGVTSARLHILETESAELRVRYALSVDENLSAFLGFAQLEQELTTLKFDVFTDMRRLLRGDDDAVTCIWGACDPYTTRAVQGIEGNGQRSNCGRTYKDGIEFVKADREGFERYLALYHTPQAHGGCQGCRFFLMCKGECPGTAIEGDWRNRSADCGVWMGLLTHLESEIAAAGETPISLSPRRTAIERSVLATWSRGQNSGIAEALRDLDRAVAARDAADRRAADTHHGDAHGDHTDAH